MVEPLVERITHLAKDGHVRVGIDGMCGSGKTTLARALVTQLTRIDIPVIHVSSDGFHQPRAIRYRAGRRSAEGYYRDTYDVDAIYSHLLDPLGPNGSSRYSTEVFDLATDQPLDAVWHTASAPLVIVYDGSFCLRPELVEHWDLRVLVDVPRTVAETRMLARDTHLGDDALDLIRERYHGAWDLHVAQAVPRERADVVIENTER